jgi:hypothetical protein
MCQGKQTRARIFRGDSRSEGKTVSVFEPLYCGPVLRHPAELMLPVVDLGGRVWLGGKPCVE